MTPNELLAEAARIDVQVKTILAEDTVAYFERRRVGGLEAMPPGWSLSSSERSKPLQARAADLRRQAKFPPSTLAAPLAAASVEPPARVATQEVDRRSRDEQIRAIAAGMPIPLPAEMVAAAIASEEPLDAFSLRAADHVIAARAAAAHEAGVSATVASILASDQPVSNPHPDPEVERLAQSILASAAVAEGRDPRALARSQGSAR